MGDHVAPAPWWRDALERVLWTFVEVFAAGLVAGNLLDLATYESAALAGVAAALAVVKTVAASRIGATGDAAIGA